MSVTVNYFNYNCSCLCQSLSPFGNDGYHNSTRINNLHLLPGWPVPVVPVSRG